MLESFQIRRLDYSYDFSKVNFDCNDSDLNDFFFNDCLLFQKALISVTYVIEEIDDPSNVVAFFSVSNDRISVEDFASNGQEVILDVNTEVRARVNRFKKFKKSVPHPKRLKSFPGVKIGRLGVSLPYQGKGLGKEIINYIKIFFLEKNKTGCRYILVDSYKSAVNFYKKNGFEFLTEGDEKDETRLMYFDLSKYASLLQEN